MSHYRRGADFERRVRHALEADGYEVIRSAGSKGAVDLVTFKTWPHRLGITGLTINYTHMLFVQAKRVNGTCPPAERLELLRLADIARAIPLVAYQPIARKPIAYKRLTGAGPKDWQPWTSDEVAR